MGKKIEGREGGEGERGEGERGRGERGEREREGGGEKGEKGKWSRKKKESKLKLVGRERRFEGDTKEEDLMCVNTFKIHHMKFFRN